MSWHHICMKNAWAPSPLTLPKFIFGKQKIYLYVKSFLNIDIAYVIETLPLFQKFEVYIKYSNWFDFGGFCGQGDTCQHWGSANHVERQSCKFHSTRRKRMNGYLKVWNAPVMLMFTEVPMLIFKLVYSLIRFTYWSISNIIFNNKQTSEWAQVKLSQIIHMAWKSKKFVNWSGFFFIWFRVFCHWQNTWNQVRTWKISCLNTMPLTPAIHLHSGSLLTHCGLVTPCASFHLGQHWQHQAIISANVGLSSIGFWTKDQFHGKSSRYKIVK